MAKLNEEFTLTCVSISPFYRLPIASSEENVYLINEGKKSVVKVNDRKLLHSWTVTHPHALTSPVIFDKKNESIYCVMDNNILLMWSINDDVLKKAVKFKFQETIFTVVALQTYAPVVIFSSGRVLNCERLSSDVEPTGDAIISKNEKMIWADAIEEGSVVYLVCIGLTKKRKQYRLHCCPVTEGSTGNYYCQTLENEDTNLKNWCLNKQTCSLVTIWSNGQAISHQFKSKSPSTLFIVPNVEEEDLLAIDCIDSNHIALVRSNTRQKESWLEIWDIKFSALKARKNIKISPPTLIQLAVVDSMIFISHDEELMEIAFHVEKSSLAAAIGGALKAPPKLQEFSWSNGQLTELSHEEDSAEKMDTSEVTEAAINPTELTALRIMQEGPSCLNYMPESELVSLLRYAIRCKVSTEKDSMTNVEPDVILNAVFFASFNDVFLVKFMKKLSLDDAMVILEVLLSVLNFKVPAASNTQDRPSDLQIFNWICLVIQSHLEALLLTKSTKSVRLLRKLEKCLSEKMKEYEDYDQSLHHLFLILRKNKNILPEDYVTGKYCIETLDI